MLGMRNTLRMMNSHIHIGRIIQIASDICISRVSGRLG